MSQINVTDFIDFDVSRKLVQSSIEKASQNPASFIRFMNQFCTWNSVFGSGVASLAGRLGLAQDVFRDPEDPIPSLADRSVLVASYVFDAARDEFNDRDVPGRTTHRCLAQATLKGMISYFHGKLDCDINKLMSVPDWMRDVSRGVLRGYGDETNLFHSMGFHLGSEILADQEFTVIDKYMTANFPELVQYLKDNNVIISGVEYPAYAWVSIHSGSGGGVEAEHFATALEGANKCLQFVANAESAVTDMKSGFLDFVANRTEFFARAVQSLGVD